MRKFLSSLALAALLVAPAFAQTSPAAPSPEEFAKEKAKVIEQMSELLRRFAFVPATDFGQLDTMLEAQKDSLEKANTPEAFVGVINRSFQQFGFSHIALFSPRAADARNTARMVGIGIRIQLEPDGIKVVFAFPEGPAMKAGLLPGDLIFEANGKPVRSTADLAGEEGTEVTVKVRRGSEVKEFTMKREPFSTVIPEKIDWLDKETAMVTIPTFDVGFNGQNVRTIMMDAAKAKNMIIDLRGNGGGAVINLQQLSGYLMTREQNLGTFIGRGDYDRYKAAHPTEEKPELASIAKWRNNPIRPARATNVEPFKGRIVVLIDPGTGSASEMLAASLREQAGAVLVGKPSAGAVLASIMRPMEHGYLLQFPLTDYVTPKGMRIEGNGIKPDHDVETLVRFGETDLCVQKAREIFAQP